MSRIRFEDTTPINKGNLDKLNNVVISSTEPTTGEEVWIQKSKNLFNKNTLTFDNKVENLSNGNIISVKLLSSSYDFFGASFELNNLSKNTDYILKADVFTGNFSTAYVYTDKLLGTRLAYGAMADGLIFNTGDSTKVIIGLYLSGVVVGTTYSIENLQVEQGKIATSYEPYIDKKIYTKNDNGVYEDFYDEKNKQLKVLWTNPSPTSNFDAQTITLSSSYYDYLLINFVASSNFGGSTIIKKGQDGQLTFITYDSGNYSYRRKATYVSDTSYTIGDAYLNDGVRNWLVVPIEIIGIKL